MDTNELLLNLVLKLEPTLTGAGMYTGLKYSEDPIPINEFMLCLEWLGQQRIGKKINSIRTSYSLKSYCEEWTKKIKGQFKYISNGAMVAAIIACGIKYCKIDDDMNVFAAVYIREEECE
ncbi:MAG: hypothetical protein NTX65_12415 [Ignavibacteriales bacterium]|nr:hypothetical protein [Ignavibacteriales bacterium]